MRAIWITLLLLSMALGCQKSERQQEFDRVQAALYPVRAKTIPEGFPADFPLPPEYTIEAGWVDSVVEGGVQGDPPERTGGRPSFNLVLRVTDGAAVCSFYRGRLPRRVDFNSDEPWLARDSAWLATEGRNLRNGVQPQKGKIRRRFCNLAVRSSKYGATITSLEMNPTGENRVNIRLTEKG